MIHVEQIEELQVDPVSACLPESTKTLGDLGRRASRTVLEVVIKITTAFSTMAFFRCAISAGLVPQQIVTTADHVISAG
ncbi:MAG: hypothetical protein M3Y33_02975 [Actinomycetota bacterium]|nr:hypothetical protein [Actinomycetota bacterium]